jgi:copper chaperone CopZ
MLRDFFVNNIRCGGCTNTITKKLNEKFSNVAIDITSQKVTVEVENEDDVEYIRNTLRKLGYPLKDETLNSLENVEMKAKSFVSCAIGKFTTSEKEK